MDTVIFVRVHLTSTLSLGLINVCTSWRLEPTGFSGPYFSFRFVRHNETEGREKQLKMCVMTRLSDDGLIDLNICGLITGRPQPK